MPDWGEEEKGKLWMNFKLQKNYKIIQAFI